MRTGHRDKLPANAPGSVLLQGSLTHQMAISPDAFAEGEVDTPLSSLGLLLMGRGLYSRLGTLDAVNILQYMF